MNIKDVHTKIVLSIRQYVNIVLNIYWTKIQLTLRKYFYKYFFNMKFIVALLTLSSEAHYYTLTNNDPISFCPDIRYLVSVCKPKNCVTFLFFSNLSADILLCSNNLAGKLLNIHQLVFFS